MRAYLKYLFISAGLAAFIYGCKESYVPDAIKVSPSVLVIEGLVDAGGDSTIIKLSRSVQLGSSGTVNPETGAQVIVEGDDGSLSQLKEAGPGKYVSPGLTIDRLKKYRLKVHAQNKDYASDFVEVNVTPVIDKVDYAVTDQTVNINVDTHDPANKTKYYRWEYEETWEFNANYRSTSISNGDNVVARDMVNNDIYHCWGNDISTTVTLGSTAKLSEDIFKDHTIISIPGESEKLGIKYSVLVKQYALTKEGFEFWQNLKKNTEQLGSIFDVQPSQLKGNIFCVTVAAEPVIGYFSVSTISRNRSFIAHDQLKKFTTKPFYTDCSQDSILLARQLESGRIVNEEDLYFNKNKGAGSLVILVPLQPIISLGGGIIGHMGAKAQCAYCTIRGKVKRPDFWQ
jgi:hypothetical protein